MSNKASTITRLHKMIIELDIPANVIAEKAGLPQTRISEYRHGKRRMPMGHIIAICQVLGCDADEIVGDVVVDEVVSYEVVSYG